MTGNVTDKFHLVNRPGFPIKIFVLNSIGFQFKGRKNLAETLYFDGQTFITYRQFREKKEN